MFVTVIADTHLPRGSRRLPDRCVELVGKSDALIHAGDISSPSALHELTAIGPPVHAVLGNVDDPSLRDVLPEKITLELGDHRVAVVHDSGPVKGRIERLRRRFPDADAVVFGHSHIPLHERAPGFQIFNPGSPTERRRAPKRSMGLMHLTPDAIRFEHVYFD